MTRKNDMSYTIQDIATFFNQKDHIGLQKAAMSILEDDPSNLDALNALALSFRYLGESLKAKESFIKLVNSNPKKDYMYSNAGNFFFDLGHIDQALQCHNQALKLNPKNLNSLNQMGLVLSNRGKDEEAIKYYQHSISIDKTIQASYDNLGNSLRNLERYKEASEVYELSNKVLSRCNQLECLYLLGDKELFYKKLKDLQRDDISHPLAAALSSHASIRYDGVDEYPFCSKPFDFIKKTELLGTEFLDEGLINEFFNEFNSLGISKKEQSLLSNGYQSSGNIFFIDKPAIQKIRKIILDQIDLYKKISDNTATFISRWPKDYELYGWVIVINDGGSLSGHMHKEGWLSGSLYLERPKKNSQHDGDITFSLHGSNFPTGGKAFMTKTIEINKGDMVLFPSSLFHATVPFKSDHKRITLAFDIIPQW